VLLLIIYILYLLFHLKSHAYLTRTIPQQFSRLVSNHEMAARASYSHEFPQISPSSFAPPPMELVNKAGRFFRPASVPDEAIELYSIDKSKTAKSKSSAGTEPETVPPATNDASETRQTRHGEARTAAGPSSSSLPIQRKSPVEPMIERPFSRSRAAALPFLSYNVSPDQPADYLTTQASSVSTNIGRPASLTLLLTCSALVSISAFFLIATIDAMVADTPLSEAFIGLIILPIAGNAAEHITAMTVASKNKMDLAIGVSVGSSIQIALCVTPAVVLLGWGMGKEMSLHFSLFETVTLVAAAGVVVVVILNGRTNYLEGWLLCACYIIVG
jgi:Ca2+:H+ antiporter